MLYMYSTYSKIFGKILNEKSKNIIFSSGLALNGTGEPQVDMLDIPGKGRCCVFIARFSYDPPE